MAWFFAAVILAAALLLTIWFFHRFYAKANRDTALVRTGLGGRKVVIDGGCFALPIVHHIQKISMHAMALTMNRHGANALLTGDRLRAEIEMEFELRVAPTAAGVTTAAQTFGRNIARGAEAVEALIQGQLANAMQDAAAARTLQELHGERASYTREVAAAVGAHVEKLGLTLISAALVRVDQGSFHDLDDNNAFTSEGLRRLAALVAENRKQRVRIETEAEISVREHRLEEARRRLDIERAEREAEIAQREHIARLEAQADAASAETRAQASLLSETASLTRERDVAAARIANDQELRDREMIAALALEETRIDHAMRLAARRAEEAEAKAAEEAASARPVLAAESARTQQEVAAAERDRTLALMEAEKTAAVEDSRARADARAVETAAAAARNRMEAEAHGRAAQIAAENGLSDAVIALRIEERRLDRLPDILGQMMKPVEKIDSIRINHLGGAPGASGAGGGPLDSAMDQILGMAVRLPAMKQLGAEIGLDFDAALAARTRRPCRPHPAQFQPTATKGE